MNRLRVHLQNHDGGIDRTVRMSAAPRVDDDIEIDGADLVVYSVVWHTDEDSDIDVTLVVR